MMFIFQRYLFQVEYRKGFLFFIADIFFRVFLLEIIYKGVYDELVYRVEFEGNNLEFFGFQDVIVQEIRIEVNIDFEQKVLRIFIEIGWLNDKVVVFVFVYLYWSVRYEFIIYEGFLYK